VNAERLEIARRFAACPKWVWLPGMLCYGWLHTSALKTVEVTAPMRIASVTDDGLFVETSIFTRGGRVVRTLALFEPSIPDLDDDLTRIGGLLAVVRMALGDYEVAAYWQLQNDASGRGQWVVGQPFPSTVRGLGYGPTEIEAILDVLEPAP
jgi:hypothetical protein